MKSGGLTGDIYKPLSDDQVETIHERALDLLEECGMTYEEGLEDVLTVLNDAGSKIDTTQNRIYFPRGLVNEMVARAPGEFVLYSRNGENDLAMGMLESMLCISYEQYILDDEIIGQGCKILEGINTDDDHLAYEAIMDVGPGGHYLASDHTMRHMRDEYFMGNGVSDKGSRTDWSEAGAFSARERAVSMARGILQQPLKAGIDPETEKQIRNDFNIYL